MNTPATEKTEPQIPAGMLVDRDGRWVPKDKVKQIDKDRDKLVKKMMKGAQKLSGSLGDFREQCFDDIADFAQHSAAQYNATMGGKKGGMTLFSYDGSIKIVLSNSEFKTFDERLQVAKSIIDECIHEWSKGANKNIQALVDYAFETDKQGRVSIAKILGLRRINIDDERWSKAMDAIADSIQTINSKQYIRFYERIAGSEDYQAVPLDAANAVAGVK